MTTTTVGKEHAAAAAAELASGVLHHFDADQALVPEFAETPKGAEEAKDGVATEHKKPDKEADYGISRLAWAAQVAIGIMMALG